MIRKKKDYWYDPAAWDGKVTLCTDLRRCKYAVETLLKITRVNSDAHGVATYANERIKAGKRLSHDVVFALELHYRQWAYGQHTRK